MVNCGSCPERSIRCEGKDKDKAAVVSAVIRVDKVVKVVNRKDSQTSRVAQVLSPAKVVDKEAAGDAVVVVRIRIRKCQNRER